MAFFLNQQQSNARSARREKRPVIGVMCCNRDVDGRQSQAVANRFIQPLGTISGAAALLVPALPDVADIQRFSEVLDGLLLTGSPSNVAKDRYGMPVAAEDELIDRDRDEVSLRLAAAMIEAGRPVFGICRGFQEINVLFGGTLTDDAGAHGHFHPKGEEAALPDLFGHKHDVEICADGLLSDYVAPGRIEVNSVHQQGVDRLGHGLTVEAFAPEDGLVEAVSARPFGAQVLGVQWHPEWHAAVSGPQNVGFFTRLGEEARAAA